VSLVGNLILKGIYGMKTSLSKTLMTVRLGYSSSFHCITDPN